MCLCVSSAHGNGSSAHGSSLNVEKKKKIQQSVTFFFSPRPWCTTTKWNNGRFFHFFVFFLLFFCFPLLVPLRFWTVVTRFLYYFFSIRLPTTCAEREHRKGIDGSYRRLSSRITGCCSNCPAMFAFSWSGIWNITRWPGMGEQWGLQGAPRGNDTVLARANGNVFFSSGVILDTNGNSNNNNVFGLQQSTERPGLHIKRGFGCRGIATSSRLD